MITTMLRLQTAQLADPSARGDLETAPDGLLPETYDSATGRWLARPWFAWPGATLAALALGAWTTGLDGASGG